MEDTVKRVLFVCSEMTPYLNDSTRSTYCLSLAKSVQEKRVEIRSFMPRYGLINERKNQLHEVIRLSGMNLIIGDVDRPLIIKVASLPSARMQVYFIDNEDYFRRKFLYSDADGKGFEDNGDRAIFFARGVLETVKKLRWSPDVIHCCGWISQVLPLYLKKHYKDDPIFSNSKVVLSLFDDTPKDAFNPDFAQHILFQNIKSGDVSILSDKPDAVSLAKLALNYSDGYVLASDNVLPEIADYAKSLGIPKMDKPSDTTGEEYTKFYNSL